MARAEGQQITNMQVQKHVFLGHGYCLALLDAPLYYNDTHAWQWGPVVAKLYKGLQKYGSGVVTDEIEASDELALESGEYGVLKAVWNAYKKYSAAQLSELTHRAGTPWSNTWARQKFGVIPVDEIRTYYAAQVASGR
jgi:uncharacterized phage-associated protein